MNKSKLDTTNNLKQIISIITNFETKDEKLILHGENF